MKRSRFSLECTVIRTRTGMDTMSANPSSLCVYQFHHNGISKIIIPFFVFFYLFYLFYLFFSEGKKKTQSNFFFTSVFFTEWLFFSFGKKKIKK